MTTPRKTVLLVDDEVAITMVMNVTLSRMGFEVLAHNDSRRALEMFISMPDKPDLLITDYHMPGLNGLELVESCRKHVPDLPVLLISGTLSLKDSDECPFPRELLLPKPFSLEELKDRIHAALGESLPVT